MAQRSGKGAKAFLIVSVIILAAAVLFTAAYAVFLSPVTKLVGGRPEPAGTDKPDAPSISDPEEETDVMGLEHELDALIEASPTAAPQADPEPTDEPGPEPTAQPTPEPTPEPTKAPQLANPFKDVSESDWFYEPALWAADKGILTGDMMSPGDPCTRAQAMTFLWREAGKPEPNLQVSPFTDVTDGSWFYKPVLWAFENGLISASTDGKFYPDNTCTRAQIMLFLFREEKGSADGLSSPYYDVPEGAYYHDAAVWAYHRGIVVLGDQKTFDADAPCTRGQFITFMYRCFAQ